MPLRWVETLTSTTCFGTSTSNLKSIICLQLYSLILINWYLWLWVKLCSAWWYTGPLGLLQLLVLIYVICRLDILVVGIFDMIYINGKTCEIYNILSHLLHTFSIHFLHELFNLFFFAPFFFGSLVAIALCTPCILSWY